MLYRYHHYDTITRGLPVTLFFVSCLFECQVQEHDEQTNVEYWGKMMITIIIEYYIVDPY